MNHLDHGELHASEIDDPFWLCVNGGVITAIDTWWRIFYVIFHRKNLGQEGLGQVGVGQVSVDRGTQLVDRNVRKVDAP